MGSVNMHGMTDILGTCHSLCWAMGDVISSHLDESRRNYITERTGKLLTEFGRLYEEQYGVALFNSVRYEIEGNGGPQTQLLHRKAPLKDRVIFSGNIYQYLEDTKKWRSRYCLVPHHYGPVLYENKTTYERGLQPRAGINCAGCKVLTSLEQYGDLMNASVPGGKVKVGGAQIKCATPFPVILWHPYSRHHFFCVTNEKEQERWSAVFQDCVRHSNDGIPEEPRLESAAFTDSVRLYRQTRDQYGTWDMMCGNQVQVLSNLVMEDLVPDLKNIICPKLRGKPQERQRMWMLISDTVYRMVYEQTRQFYEGLEKRCSEKGAAMESQIRTDMDQIISCKEHVFSKIRAVVLPKAELCVRNHIQAHIPSILDALMVPTSQGFAEVRDLLFRETTEMNMNLVNEGGREKLGEQMEKLSQLAYHPVKMQQCYEKMDQLNLEGLQQRFDVGSPSVFKQRAQILMREQMDNAVYTFEQLVHQELSKSESGANLCRDIQRILERVLKKYDYDSSSVRKKFFQEALLQIIIPFLLKKLAPTCKAEFPRFQELIFEDLSRYVLVENTYEEVVLQSVMRDIVQAVKDAATQRKHNLYRDSIVMHNSDPNLHLLGEGAPIDWSQEYTDHSESANTNRHGRLRQVVSMLHEDEGPDIPGSCQEVPAQERIAEIPEDIEVTASCQKERIPKVPEDSDVAQIRGMLVKEFDVEVSPAAASTVPVSEVPRVAAIEVKETTGDKAQADPPNASERSDSENEEVEKARLLLASELARQLAEEEQHHVHIIQDHVTHAAVEMLHSEKDGLHRSDQGNAAEPVKLGNGEILHSDSEMDPESEQVGVPKYSSHREDDHMSLEIPRLSTTVPCQKPREVSAALEDEIQSGPVPHSPTHVVHSTPDDSGFQSPISEGEEEGDGYREIPVPAPRKRGEIVTQF
ncbi:niban apoptosis regulator 2 isoform X1 [Xenopus tropicalis]|uniref:Niban apoptosis regulator 2 n=1 Tax=Xenopus tropicalis TaxID=8364 RepID=A0A6I8SR50_XENTR|nr:niban apoptosis regulator 2 isoform X1 [Xenopus tropicalis]|eukprot:XP_012823459.1 PREDICTED: family with sequence similarity 129 member B isoform X1 [Xenopus tropicalis]